MKNRRVYGAIGCAALALLLVLACWLLFFRSPGGGGTYDNLIRNGGFEITDDDGMPADWYTEAWISQGYTTYDLQEGPDGKAAYILNLFPNDARFVQTVSVSPDTLYCLHGRIRADVTAEDGSRGANLSIENLSVYSECLYDTDGEWQEVSLYGRTGPKQRTVTIFVRLGGYSGEATGEAWFDDISFRRVDEVPAGYYEMPLYEIQSSTVSDVSKERTGSLWLILVCAAYAGIFCALARFLVHAAKWNPKTETIVFGAAMLLFFALRILTAALIPGYDVDIGCFRSWAGHMASVGPTKFYTTVGFCDYPPGYLWALWMVGLLGKAFGGVSELMVKLPVILADMALCFLLYREGKKALGGQQALMLCLLMAANPLSFAAGAAWGQTDSLMTVLLCVTVICALRGQWKAALPVYVLAMLVKPQALMFGPLGAAALLLHILKNAQDAKKRKVMLRDVLLGLGLSAAVAAVVVLPFTPGQSWDWLIQLYGQTMGEYGHATVNACNLYFLFGKNWTDSAAAAPWYIALCAFLLLAVPCILAHWDQYRALLSKNNRSLRENRPAVAALLSAVLSGALLLALAVLMILGRLTYSALSACMIAACVALFSGLLLTHGKGENLPLFGAAMLMMLFAAGGMMHERYLFPAAALLLLAYTRTHDRRILYLAVGVSLTGLLNVGCALDRNIRIGGAEGHLDAPDFNIQSDMAFLEYLAAAGNCLLGAAGVYLACALAGENTRVLALRPAAGTDVKGAVREKRKAPLPENAPLRKMTKKDWLILSVATALYAVLAFTNLGSTKAPQTAWVSQASYEQGTTGQMTPVQESVVLDLGESRVFNMAYFLGIHHSDYTFLVETGEDGETWPQAYEASANQGDCFKWKYVPEAAGGADPAALSGRYVRISARNVSLTLFETLFRDAETKESIQASLVSSSLGNETAACLVDEPDTLEGEPGWYNSAYFDEIYHARTAYEHLHGLTPYETTHPPLGKVLMSFCIAVFGMTPFGWRFAGALAGVLMLPGMYLLGKLLIKKEWGGLGAMLLMALDLMHFTQTRIATIDSFVVLFIIWAVYFMLRWFMWDFFGTKFVKTLMDLFLSGLFMGFAIASKWTGCYAAAGLAVIFFFGLRRRIREIIHSKKLPEAQLTNHDRAARAGVRPLCITVALCFLFFIAIPLTIYYLSYIPYFAPSGGVTVEKVIHAAVGDYFTTGVLDEYDGMLGYHSKPGRGMDHFFYSPWYEWPIIAKPMWYAEDKFEPAGTARTIMAMGNPAVWWTGLAALFGVICLWAKRHIVVQKRTIVLHPEHDDPRYALLILCFLAQYLPWMLVPRGTYIYHYFPSVPFIILCTMLCLDWIAEKHDKAARVAFLCLMAAALILFILFFPYASGITASEKWLDAMKWFPRWLWY